MPPPDWFRKALTALSVWFFFIYGVVVFFRLWYPYSLELYEGVMAEQVLRILEGRVLYVEPSLEYIPSVYPPLYFYLSALVAKFSGIGFFPLRLVSFAASLGAFFLVYLLVKKETGNKGIALASAALLAAVYKINRDWYDIARVESLFLFWTLAALCGIRFAKTAKGLALAGLCAGLAFLSKQTALVIFLPLFFYSIFVHRGRSFWLIGTAAAVIGLTTVYFERVSGGWYAYYLFKIPGQHAASFIGDRVWGFWLKDLLAGLPIAFPLALVFFFGKDPGLPAKTKFFYICAALGMLGVSWLGRLPEGGARNALFPAFAWVAVVSGLSAAAFLAKGKDTAVYFLCALQLALLLYDPLMRLPTRESYQAGENTVKRMAQAQGEVYAPSLPFVPRLAGKRSYAHPTLLKDIRGADPERGEQLIAQTRQAFKDGKFAAIFFEPNFFDQPFGKNYVKAEPVSLTGARFWAHLNGDKVYERRSV
ncbi:MAG: ArnT family glycosyltransferase [Candidatus Omnitrophota bacterium]